MNFLESLEAVYQPQSEDPFRSRCWNRFIELGGLPKRKAEAFRYVPLRKLFEKNYEDLAFQIMAITGSETAQILSFEEAMPVYRTFIENRWNALLKRETDPFALLNMALHHEAHFIYVPPGTMGVRLECSLASWKERMAFPRVHIVVGKGAEVSFDAYLNGEGFLHAAFDVVLEEGAKLRLLRECEPESDDTWHFTTLRATQKKYSRLTSFTHSEGGETVRDDIDVQINGEEAEVNLMGLNHLQNQRHSHTQVLVEHVAPHCRSRQHFKSVLADASRASFEGKIFVQKDAQKTDAFQMNNTLLLGEHARADSKPNLEVFADDVKASHGATIGQLEPEQMHYLQTRGFSKKQAQEVLVDAFCRDIEEAFVA